MYKNSDKYKMSLKDGKKQGPIILAGGLAQGDLEDWDIPLFEKN